MISTAATVADARDFVLARDAGGTTPKAAWLPFKINAVVELKPGNLILGPAIIRDRMTAVVIPPAREIWTDAFMLLHYHAIEGKA